MAAAAIPGAPSWVAPLSIGLAVGSAIGLQKSLTCHDANMLTGLFMSIALAFQWFSVLFAAARFALSRIMLQLADSG